MYNSNSQITLETTMLKLNSCYQSDAYILVKGTITVIGAVATAAARQTNRSGKQAILNKQVVHRLPTA